MNEDKLVKLKDNIGAMTMARDYAEERLKDAERNLAKAKDEFVTEALKANEPNVVGFSKGGWSPR